MAIYNVKYSLITAAYIWRAYFTRTDLISLRIAKTFLLFNCFVIYLESQLDRMSANSCWSVSLEKFTKCSCCGQIPLEQGSQTPISQLQQAGTANIQIVVTINVFIFNFQIHYFSIHVTRKGNIQISFFYYRLNII